MINLCLVVIATQFSETKKREMERMKMERARFHSTSTLTSSTNNSEPSSCYSQMVKHIYISRPDAHHVVLGDSCQRLAEPRSYII
ncbi:voltage-dependent T-type calcium channel subunit alpha-1G-like [Sipha flava]|uniref:Voltage-dependent T-type calcium channel subunit alpha-1G-like n=1 Tax=Sipha flava TaxID=143950 RepID=A0A8B8GC75_9HEMI|nr:voltage-dependent T-type calcium channel subunit alpha-1G-like [Sipha flava]